jgi:DNA-binding GntR family transcriptional regulator
MLRCCGDMSRVSGLVERVRLMILRGDVPPGGRMMELLLAERFGTSRATVREALRQLEGDGLLIANADGGMRLVRLGEDDLIDALRVRAALEELSAGLAAERLADGRAPVEALSRLGALADAADAAARSGPAEEAVLADRKPPPGARRARRERPLPRRAPPHLGPDRRRDAPVGRERAAAGVGRP